MIEDSFKKEEEKKKEEVVETQVTVVAKKTPKEAFSFAEAVEMLRLPRVDPNAKKGFGGGAPK